MLFGEERLAHQQADAARTNSARITATAMVGDVSWLPPRS